GIKPLTRRRRDRAGTRDLPGRVCRVACSLPRLLALPPLTLRLLALPLPGCLRTPSRHKHHLSRRKTGWRTGTSPPAPVEYRYAPTLTFAACGPLSPCCCSYETLWPSGSVL